MKRRMWSAAAGLVLVATSVFAATPAMAAGTCQAQPNVVSSSAAMTVYNPCANLSGKYKYSWTNANGTKGSVTRTVVPLGNTTFYFNGAVGYSLIVV